MSPPSETSRRSNRCLSALTYCFTSDIDESDAEHLIKFGIIRKILKNYLTGKLNQRLHARCGGKMSPDLEGKTVIGAPFIPLARVETLVTISPDQIAD